MLITCLCRQTTSDIVKVHTYVAADDGQLLLNQRREFSRDSFLVMLLRENERIGKCTRCNRNEKSDRRRKYCALAVVRRRQKISPRRRPLPGGSGRPKFNQLEMVTTFTYKPSLVKIDARNFELLW